MNPYLKQFEIHILSIEENLKTCLRDNYLPPFMFMLFQLDTNPVIFKVEDADKLPEQVREHNADAIALIARSFYTIENGEELPCIVISYKDKTNHQFTRIYPVTINEDEVIMDLKYFQIKDENNLILNRLFSRLH